jgi:hypothetical protein
MTRKRYARIVLSFALLLCTVYSAAQSGDEVPLGDLARSFRKDRPPAAPAVIDNDNLAQVMDAATGHHPGDALLFSIDGPRNRFQMTSPDGTCSLSFNANAASLLSDPDAVESLPAGELAKLEGPASLDGDDLQVSIFNGTDWNLKEITVGVTLVRPEESEAAFFKNARLLPAAQSDDSENAGKPSDSTILIHMRVASAAPLLTTMFREKLGAAIAPDQEWHWAIVGAKGIPPTPLINGPAF